MVHWVLDMVNRISKNGLLLAGSSKLRPWDPSVSSVHISAMLRTASYLFLSMTSLQLRGCRWGWQELHAPGESHMLLEALESVVFRAVTSPIWPWDKLCQNLFTPKCGWFNMVQYGLIYIYIILIPNTYFFRCF